MRLIRCKRVNNHYYDGDIQTECPQCKILSDDGRTMILPPVPGPEPSTGSGDVPTGDIRKIIKDLNHTVSLSASQSQNSDREDDEPDEPVIYYSAENNANSMPPDDEGKTVRYSSRSEDAKEPLVGWLVGLNGKVFGEGFPLFTGRNYIGRDAKMDVVLRGDRSVSRDKHAVVIYEPKSRKFLIQPGESKELFYMNDEAVLDTQTMSNGCELCIGETRLKFVAFCGEDFSWETNSQVK